MGPVENGANTDALKNMLAMSRMLYKALKASQKLGAASSYDHIECASALVRKAGLCDATLWAR